MGKQEHTRVSQMGEIFGLLVGQPSLIEQNVSHTVVFYYSRTRRKKTKSQADTFYCEQKFPNRNQVYRDGLTN